MTRPLNCIIHSEKVFGEQYHPKLNLGEAIIWIILMLLAIVFLFVIRIFSYEFLMHPKFIIASSDWIFNGWLLVVQNLVIVIQTILVEESPLFSALLNVGVHCLYGEYVIFKSPIKRIGGNQLGGVYLWVVGCGVVISAFAAYILAGRIARNKWVIKPVTVIREAKHPNPAELNKEVFNLNKKGHVDQQKLNSTTPGNYSGSSSGSSSLQSTVTNLTTKECLIKPDTTNINNNKQKIKLKEITVGFSIMMSEGEEIGYILNPVLEEVPEQFHQHLGAQKHVIRVLTKEHRAHNAHHHHPHHPHHHIHHENGHHSGLHNVIPHHFGDYSVHSHQGSLMLPLSQSGTVSQSTEKSQSLKSSSSSLTKKYADNARDSFAVPYINDYATYIWAYNLSSHPELLMAAYPLKSNTQLNKSLVRMLSSSQTHFMHHFFAKMNLDKALNYTQHMPSSYKIIDVQCSLNYLHTYKKHVNTSLDGHPIGLFYRLMKQAEESMESGKMAEQLGTGGQQQVVSKSQNAGSAMTDSQQHSINIQIQQADIQYEISKAHLIRVWSLLTRRSVDVGKVEHHIRIASQNARLAQEQYNALLIAHSENANIVRQYSNEEEIGQNDVWGVDANEENQQDSEQKDLEGQDSSSGIEGDKTLQKSDSLTDGNTPNNNKSKSVSGVVRAGSQKNEIIKKLQTKQTRQSKTFILIFSFLFISLGLVIVLFIFSYIFVSTNFTSAVDAGRAERDEILAAEYMNFALDYSTYYMFSILTLDQDGGSDLDTIYEEAQGDTYPLLLFFFQEYHQLYEWAHNKKEWRTAKAIWNDVKLQNITVGKIGVGPDMEITNSTTDELRLTRFIQWIENTINVMLQLFAYNPEDTTRERGDFYTMKQQLAVIALNVPFAATKEMKIVAQTEHTVVQSNSDISIIVVAVCFVVATLIMIIGSNIPM
ncbi:MAG: hypothetical protein EZS28_023055 [Streblomastix strix]|uniref:Uncharacterized protein n=1 Tax=Streblomastix strix TaxID=222440 RepID=A0A5J4VFM4_9EUKA|nr:MAG: hypothetical protein EZS28_023055 [Streblomastix strix]